MVAGRNRPGLIVASVLTAALAVSARGQVLQYSIHGDADSGYGSAVSRAGDIDGDGYEDFIVGAPYEGSTDQGAAFVISGASGVAISSLSGANDYADLGAAVDGRIDIDGDGYPDVLVGAPYDGIGEAGSVLVYSPHRQTTLYVLNGPTGSGLGSSVRSLQADLDGDGIDDFIVGAPGIDPSFTPKAYVYSGATGSLLFKKVGQAGSHFGTAVCRAGDLDGDGVCDFLVGSPDYLDASAGVVGRIAAFSGKTGSKIWDLNGFHAGSRFGASIAQPGDFDADGTPDCIVGAPFDLDPHGTATGTVYAVSGATGTAIYEVSGDTDGDQFGFDVRGAGGDVDGDGRNDFLVGAPGNFSSPGYARLFSGPAGAVIYTYVEQTSDPSGFYAKYGTSVCGGDFNRDGRTDVLIGDYHYDAGQGLIEVFDTALASWRSYGSGWPGTLGVPWMTPQTNPIVGQTLDISISNSAGVATTALVLIGLDQAQIPTSKGGTLLVDPLLLVPLSLPAAGLDLFGLVPDDQALYGLHGYLQTLELDSGASKGVSFSAGLDLFFGFP